MNIPIISNFIKRQEDVIVCNRNENYTSGGTTFIEGAHGIPINGIYYASTIDPKYAWNHNSNQLFRTEAEMFMGTLIRHTAGALQASIDVQKNNIMNSNIVPADAIYNQQPQGQSQQQGEPQKKFMGII